MNKYITVTVIFAAAYFSASSQKDSLKVLNEDAFINLVKEFHPIAKQGTLLVENARAGLLTARGSFDPAVNINNDRKTFDGKKYYTYLNGQLTIPSWYGIEVRTGYEKNSGDLIANELTPGKSSYMGITLPLAKNLLLDKRRAALQQAKLFTQQSEQDRRIVINDLLLDAFTAYWNWAKDYQVYKILSDVVALNNKRFELIKLTFEQGDRARIDTVEAFAQLQNFSQQQQESFLKYRKSSLELSNFLWTDTEEPAYIAENIIPDSIWVGINIAAFKNEDLEKWLDQLDVTHPKLQSLTFKIKSLDVEKKLKFQNLLPKVDLKYNFLQKGYEPWKNVSTPFLENNYKFGLGISVPLLLRQGRGELKAAKIKVKSTSLEKALQQLQLENKVRYYYSEVLGITRQIQFTETASNSYRELFKAEELRFSFGETSLFLLNSRESQYLSAYQKLLELKAKFFQSRAALQWAAGKL